MTEPTPAMLHESAMNHFASGNGIEAARQLQWALIGDPNYAEAWHSRALVLQALSDPFDAISCCEKAIVLNPSAAAYWNTKGVCWAKLHQYGLAVECYDRAIGLNDKLSPAWHNKGTAARLAGNIDDAVAFYEMAVNLRPDNPDYHVSYSSALLAAGRLVEGWHEYEYRFKTNDAISRNMPLPEWRGEEGATVILYAEQGFGDTIQFMRYASKLSKHGVKVILEVKKPMLELAKCSIGTDFTDRYRFEVIAYGDPLPSNATHCLPIMSAARFCGVDTIYDIDGHPYVGVPKYPIRNATQQALQTADGLRVGLCWHTGVRPYQPELREIAESKSIAPQFLQPLAHVKDISWFSLQLPSNELPFPMIDLTRELYDFYETAKLMQCLDAVVTVDTSVAHLAGALGIPTLVMTPRDNCWRWFGNRPDSPWYNSMQQYRQPSPGDWPSVIANVIEHLEFMKACRDGKKDQS